MDPVSATLLSAFVVGAAKGLTKVGESAVAESYAVLKSLLKASYASASDLLGSIAAFEQKPESTGRRETLAEELREAGALDDRDLVAAAEAVLAAAEKSNHTQAIGIDWQDVKAARLKIGEIRARAGSIGFRAARLEITGEIVIPKVDVGGNSGK